MRFQQIEIMKVSSDLTEGKETLNKIIFDLQSAGNEILDVQPYFSLEHYYLIRHQTPEIPNVTATG